ncbi:hypothetical protein [Mucilaginibacter sp.]|uniref:hypothetical protein n=1 Tax=Mucilaginibacter sp. TaxID=1882438 RepID=UPI00261EB166|nr:hypothetical protein [Mucilaginibacter sp.]MDB5129427.1 hypothetical protein [Mucilaginibacter sp.]
MSKDNRFIIRRTFSQERFEILWKKRKNGQATLRDLTEMDEIVNRDPSVRQFVLEEMENMENPADNNDLQDMLQQPTVSHQSITDKIKAFFNRLFNIIAADSKLLPAN